MRAIETQPSEGAPTMIARTLAVATAATASLALSGTASAEDWKWTVTPYVWATDVGIDARVHDRDLVDATIPFADLVDDIRFVAQVRAQAMHGEHGLALDLFSVSMADDSGRVPLPNGAELALDTRIDMTILDVTGLYAPAEKGFSWLYGLRLINQREDIDAQVRTGNVAGPGKHYDANDTYVDALVGARYSHALGDRWTWTLSADIGTGGTDLTWSVSPTIGYSFGQQQRYQVIAGYRYLAIDFKTASDVDMDMTLDGFLIGFRFAF
jgi:hypothetical protein